MASYRLITTAPFGTYDEVTDWFAPASTAAFTTPGIAPNYHGPFTVSAFSAPITNSTAAIQYSLSGFTQNLSAVIAKHGGGYAVAAFTSDPGSQTPVSYPDHMSINSGIYTDNLIKQDWSIALNSETSIGSTDLIAANINTVIIKGFQHANLKLGDGATTPEQDLNVQVNNAQAGDLDMSQAPGHVTAVIAAVTASDTTTQHNFTYQTSRFGDSLEVVGGTYTGLDAYGGAFDASGMTQQVDVIGSHGGNTIDLTGTSMSSWMRLSGGALTFGNFEGNGSQTSLFTSSRGDEVLLSQTGTNGASINVQASQPNSGLRLIENFTFGRDHLAMALGDGGFLTVDLPNLRVSGVVLPSVAVLDQTGSAGVILTGHTVAELQNPGPHLSFNGAVGHHQLKIY